MNNITSADAKKSAYQHIYHCSAVEESGDYKHIAHISNNGKIKLYVSESYIPVEDMQRIEQAKEKFLDGMTVVYKRNRWRVERTEE